MNVHAEIFEFSKEELIDIVIDLYEGAPTYVASKIVEHIKVREEYVAWEVRRLISEREFIRAIKHYRQGTHASLRDAKRFCELLREEMIESGEIEAPPHLAHIVKNR